MSQLPECVELEAVSLSEFSSSVDEVTQVQNTTARIMRPVSGVCLCVCAKNGQRRTYKERTALSLCSFLRSSTQAL